MFARSSTTAVDPDSVAAAIGQALAMPLAERRERHDSLFRAGTPNSGAGVQGMPGNKSGPAAKPQQNPSGQSSGLIRIQVKFLDCLETNPGLHHKNHPSEELLMAATLAAFSCPKQCRTKEPQPEVRDSAGAQHHQAKRQPGCLGQNSCLLRLFNDALIRPYGGLWITGKSHELGTEHWHFACLDGDAPCTGSTA
jgi:hypothetical protein